ncbi:MAG: phosphonate C-P lyase system protein PhnH [Candidatus Thiodiazotropha sp. 6PLUC6]
MWEKSMLDVTPIWTVHIQQQNYRALLQAMSRPGSVSNIGCGDNDKAYLAVLATLLDGEVSLADPQQLLNDQDWPLLQAAPLDSTHADYLLLEGSQTTAVQPKLGTLPSPEDSSTLIISVQSLTQGDLHLRLSGPGVNGTSDVAIDGLHHDWISQREEWVCAFPLGVDMILVDQDAVMALPRTTRVEVI